MNNLKQIFQKLGISDDLQKLIFGDIKVPILVEYRSIYQYWHPHPPCLIPMFLDNGEAYQGILHHFFCNRKTTFVKWSFETDYFSEIARNENQLFTIMVLNMIINDEGITKRIIDFCKSINFEKYPEIDEYALNHGDNLDNPTDLIYYNEHTPFIYIKDYKVYDGDFPSSLTTINPKEIFNSSSYELPERRLESNEIDEISEWLKNDTDKKNLFDQFVDNNQLKEAWFTLNSKDWYLKDVANALESLKEKTSDTLFHLVANNWLERWNEAKDNNQTNDSEKY